VCFINRTACSPVTESVLGRLSIFKFGRRQAVLQTARPDVTISISSGRIPRRLRRSLLASASPTFGSPPHENGSPSLLGIPRPLGRGSFIGAKGAFGGGVWAAGGLSAEANGAALYAATGNALGKNQSAGLSEHVVRLTRNLA